MAGSLAAVVQIKSCQLEAGFSDPQGRSQAALRTYAEEVAVELKELRRIKREYERLKIEHALLKKAIEFSSTQKAKSSSSSTTRKKSSR